MANVSKAKGTNFESSIAKYMNDWAGEKVCERVVLHGNKDHGDLRITVDDIEIVGEAKWRKKYPSSSEEKDFRKQTDTETNNADLDEGVLFINKFNQSLDRTEVWMHAQTCFVINGFMRGDENYDFDWVCMRLDDFCKMCFGGRHEQQ